MGRCSPTLFLTLLVFTSVSLISSQYSSLDVLISGEPKSPLASPSNHL